MSRSKKGRSIHGKRLGRTKRKRSTKGRKYRDRTGAHKHPTRGVLRRFRGHASRPSVSATKSFPFDGKPSDVHRVAKEPR